MADRQAAGMAESAVIEFARKFTRRAFNRYTVVAACSFLGQRLFIWIFIDGLGWHYQVASSLASLLSFTIVFNVHRRWTFNRRKPW